MVENDAYHQALSEALRHAESNDFAAVRSAIESNAEPVEASRRYADLAQALYRSFRGAM